MVAQFPIADRYEIKEAIGEGGMGVVYRALDLKTKSYVALKTMRDVSDPAAVALFSKEWSVLAGISHPNIVDIRDVGEIEEQGQKKPFFVMPLLPGATLSKLIETSSPRLTVEHVVGIICQVSRGLQAAHEKNLVHRDIKPSNIFVMDDDTAKIIDFGVVYLAGSQSVKGHKGTWQYMSPEQIELKPASPVSDIFSLGVVCYETLTGRKPFARKTPAETADAVRRYIPPPISEINPSVSQLVSMVIHKAMAKQPMHRFQSVRDFGETLQKAHLNQPIERFGFDRSKIEPRIERAKRAFEEGDSDFASEILGELETEGHIDPEIAVLRVKIDQARRQKKIRQLLETARTRLEQNEIPLALEKLQEVLEIDPENADAHALRASVEKQRNEGQIESWLDLARRHLDRHDFAEARQALTEVLKIRPSDAVAKELLDETERRQEEAARIRKEKEQLYGSALRAYNGGEISAALSKLERLLELGQQAPDAAVPDRDSVYQSFYNQVRSDRDSIHKAYEEARRHLAEQNFARALEVCDEFTGKYPSDAIFQALKLEVTEKQRQELSAYIAEIGRRVDEEQDLDRKVNLLKEACERYPSEQQFQQTLKLTRERRELVFSIVAKARHYEEESLFTDAIGQWDILRSIYPRYPGIEVEVSQLVKRRDHQVRDEAKTRVIEQIDRTLDTGDFARARDMAANALIEYPQDHELTGLAQLARQGLERSSEARALSAEAEELRAQGRFQEAVASLRRAIELDPKNRSVREALVNALVEQARPLAEAGDWRSADPLLQLASELDPAHAAVRSLRTLIADSKRKDFVSQCLAEARDLRASGNQEAALAKVESALAQYPNETRLAQLQATLQSSVRDARRLKDRPGDLAKLHEILGAVQETANAGDRAALLRQSQEIARKYPDDPEIGSIVAAIQHQAGAIKPQIPQPAPVAAAGGESIFAAPTVGMTSAATVADQATQALPPDAKTSPIRSTRTVSVAPYLVALKTAAGNLEQKVRPKAGNGFSWLQIAILVTVVVLIGAAILVSSQPKPVKHAAEAPAPVIAQIAVQIQTTPPDAVVTVNGEAKSGQIDLLPNFPYNVTVSRLGYKTEQEQTMHAAPTWNFTLSPEPVRLNLSTSEKAAEAFLDDQSKGDLQSGQLQALEIPTDGADHIFEVRNGTKPVLSFTFSAKPAEAPRVRDLKPKDLVVISSLGNNAVVYSGSSTLRANLSGQELKAIPPEGLALIGVSADNNELEFNGSDHSRIPIEAGNNPVLAVSLNAAADIAYLKVQCNAPNARLFVEGVEIKPSKPGVWRSVAKKPGKYSIRLTAEGFQDHEERVELAADAPLQKNVELKPNPVINTATLVVAGGVPGAEVLVDELSAGMLDSSGAGRFTVSSGQHRVRLRKNFFEPSSEFTLNFPGGREVKWDSVPAKLKEYGTLQFKITPADAQISFRRSEQNAQTARGRESVRVPEGKYLVTAEAGGFAPQTKEISILAGQSASVEIALTPLVAKKVEPVPERNDYQFETPAKVKKVGEWFKGSVSGDWVFLKAGAYRQLTLVFPDPGKNLFGKERRVAFVAGYLSDQQRIVYEFDGKKLTRKVYSEGKSTSSFVNCRSDESAIQFAVTLSPSRIVVESRSCDAPSSYDASAGDLTRGKIGIKNNVEFAIK